MSVITTVFITDDIKSIVKSLTSDESNGDLDL